MLEVRCGDCIEGMASLDADSIDAIVCDPPYGLEFMGAEWDTFRVDERSARWASRSGAAGGFAETEMGTLPSYGKRRTIPVDVVPVEMRAFQNWVTMWAVEAYRVLKPGGHLLAFGGSRTYHRLASGIEDAGFDVRDQLMWLYGQGFPKSLDVSKSIDAKLGADRQDEYADTEPYDGANATSYARGLGVAKIASHPVTDEAIRYAGYGTALKPAHEPIVLARKPVNGTVAENVLRYGTGALDIDATRIGTTGGSAAVERATPATSGATRFPEHATVRADAGGRWPANVLLTHHPECRGHGSKRSAELCHEECPVRMLNEQSGESSSSSSVPVYEERDSGYGGGWPGGGPGRRVGADDSGGAARFFYTAKAPTKERIAGVDRSLHPTVKPTAVMRWLIRLVTPPGGLVLDPFTGSGTTGVAAVQEGFDFLGYERDPDYARQATERIADHAFARGRELTSPAAAATPSPRGHRDNRDAETPEEGP